jgi:hypothetical protein
MTQQIAMTSSINSVGTQELLNRTLREFLLVSGKDSVGKTSAVLSLAWYVEQISPGVVFYLIDSENKVAAALRSFGADAPRNIRYYKACTMNAVTSAVESILADVKPGDWLAVESMSRIWEMAQDMGYQEVSGMGKAAYLAKWRDNAKKGGPIPKPDDLWSIVKGAHNGAFLDLLVERDDLNVILTTTIAKPRQEGFGKESADRKAVRVELGIDVGIEGAPRLPYFPETFCLLDLREGRVKCRVLRDNLSPHDETRIEFDVPDRKSFGTMFYGTCR